MDYRSISYDSPDAKNFLIERLAGAFRDDDVIAAAWDNLISLDLSPDVLAAGAVALALSLVEASPGLRAALIAWSDELKNQN